MLDSHRCDKILQKINLNEQRVILAGGFRGFSLQLAGSSASRPMVRHSTVEAECVAEGDACLLAARKEKEKEGARDGGSHHPCLPSKVLLTPRLGTRPAAHEALGTFQVQITGTIQLEVGSGRHWLCQFCSEWQHVPLRCCIPGLPHTHHWLDVG